MAQKEMNKEIERKNVLISCEESQVVALSFEKMGHNAKSNDILECSGGRPDIHIRDSIFHELSKRIHVYHFLGGHPPCTYLCNSGVRWLYKKDGSKNLERWEKMELAASFFKSLLSCVKSVGMGYLENPIMHKHAMAIIGEKPSQIIQPWQFGHGETKATCLWLVGLPLLKPTDIVEGRLHLIHKMPPSKDRAKLRSKTYPGIARAMAQQWSHLI